MTATSYNMIIPQGEDWAITFPVKTSTGSPVNLTGYTATAQVRPADRSTVLYSWSAAKGNLSMDAAGNLTLTVPAVDSAGWGWDHGLYDIRLVDPEGLVIRVAKGSASVDPAVTTA